MMKMEILSCSMISLSCAYWSLRSFSGIIEEVKRLNAKRGGKAPLPSTVLGTRLRKNHFLLERSV